MKKNIHISLKGGERIYINGAVLRVDRKVSIEFLNDVTFLLENHVILAEEAKTPLKAHYFIAQTMLIDPTGAAAARDMFARSHALLMSTFEATEVRAGLEVARSLVEKDKVFEALKAIRALFPLEDRILTRHASDQSQQTRVASCR